MMTYKLFSLLFIATLFIGCNDSDTAAPITNETVIKVDATKFWFIHDLGDYKN
jgi:hypothetical protein